MRIRALLLTSAAGLAFVFGSQTLFPSAYAQKGAFISPVTQWGVTSVKGDAVGNGRYCAVARKFEGDTILTFAQNPNHETSFALDFRKFKFDPSRSLNIVLDPGAGEQRVYDVKPLSAKAFVVKLGRDAAFFRALRTTGYLRVQAANQSYIYNISDIDLGQTKLASCLDDMLQPAVDRYNQQPHQPQMPVQSGYDGLDGRIKALEVQNAALSDQLRQAERLTQSASVRASGAQQLAGLGAELEALKAENELLKTQVEKSVSGVESQTLKQRLAQLETDNEKLRANVKEASSRGDVEKEYTQKLAEAKADNEKLQGRVEELLAYGADNKGAEEELTTLKARNDALNAELVELKVSLEKKQTAEVDALKAENEALRAEVQSLSTGGDVTATLEKKIEALEGQNTDLLKQVSALSVQADIAKDEVEDVSVLREAKDKTIEALNKTIAILRGENKRQSEELSKTGALKGEVAKLQGENDRLKSELSELSDSKSKDIKVLEQDLQDAQEEAKGAQKDAALLGGLQSRLEQAVAYNNELEEKLRSVQGQLEDAQISQNVAQEHGTLAEILREENELLKGRVNTQVSAVESLRAEVSQLRADKEDLQQRIDTMSKEHDLSIAALQGSLSDEHTQSVAALKEELAAAKISDQYAQEREGIIDDLKLQLRTAMQAKEAMEQHLVSMKSELKGSDQQLMAMAKYEEMAKVLQQENEILKSRIVEMSNTVQMVSAKPPSNDHDEISGSAGEDSIAMAFAELEPAAGDDAQADFPASAAMSDAQRYEQELLNDLEGGGEPPAMVIDQDKPVNMSVGEDPYEDFEVMEAPDPFKEPEVEPVSAPPGGVQTSEPVDREELKPEFAPSKGVSVANISSADVASEPSFVSLLDAVGVVGKENVSRVADASGADFVAYQWKISDVYGSAEQRRFANGDGFDNAVKDYLTRTQDRCTGDFAVIPSASKDVGDMRVDAYDIACVGQGLSSAASLVFYSEPGMFTAMAHEISADRMDEVMSIRDKVFAALVGGAKS